MLQSLDIVPSLKMGVSTKDTLTLLSGCVSEDNKYCNNEHIISYFMNNGIYIRFMGSSLVGPGS